MNTAVSALANTAFLKLFMFFVAGILVARLSNPFIKKYLHQWDNLLPLEVRGKILSGLTLPLSLFIMCGIWFAGLHFYPPKPEWHSFLIQPIRFLVGYSFILLLYQALDIFEISIQKRVREERDSLHRQILPYFKKILKILIAMVAVLMVLQSAGFNVTTILASLGIGGLAVALAAKESLKDIFGGLAIIADKPFALGDWIVCGDMEGTVMDIGFRSTQLKTFYDSVITVPNSVIADSVVDNLGRRKARRTRFTLDLTYDTSPEEMEAFVEGVKNIIAANPCTRKDYYQVYFNSYESFSLRVFVNFFLKVSNWDEELLQKQNIYLEILRLGRQLKVSFAFPTQTVEVSRLPHEPALAKNPLSPSDLKSKAKGFGPGGELSSPKGQGLFTPAFKQHTNEKNT